MGERALWAPWRIEYVRAHKGNTCPLCDAIAHRESEHLLVIERGDRCVTMLNAYPYASGHLMILPSRHAADLRDLSDGELAELMRLTRRALYALSAVMAPDGFNLDFRHGGLSGLI